MSSSTLPGSRLYSLQILTVLLLCIIPPIIVAQTIIDIHVSTPRDFGYTVGDKIRHEMHLSLNEPNRLDTTTLPETGRLNRWLEISLADAAVRYREKMAIYRIVIEYQIVNAPQELTSVTIPQFEFLITGGTNPLPVFVPEWTFSIGPITNSEAHGDLSLQPDRRPRAIPVTGRRIRLIIWLLLLGGSLIYLAYRRFLLPRLERNRYPFSIALAELHRLQRRGSDPEHYQLGLRAFHLAVNTTAGQVVFAGNLHDFLSANSKFAALRAEFTALYARSQDVFFEDAEATDPNSAMQELVNICRHCRALERSVT